MTKTTNHVPQPSLILFGLTSIGKPKAGAFKPTEVEAARKAAAKLGLQVFEIADENSRAFAAKVPAGRIHGHGDAIVPFVPKALYASIESLARPKPATAAKLNSPIAPPSPVSARQLE